MAKLMENVLKHVFPLFTSDECHNASPVCFFKNIKFKNIFCNLQKRDSLLSMGNKCSNFSVLQPINIRFPLPDKSIIV